MSGPGNPGVTGVVAGERDEQQVECRFEIRKQIMLGFFSGGEQHDVLIDPGRGKLMFNDRDIYWLIDNEQRMSDSINDAIPIWLCDSSIEEVWRHPALRLWSDQTSPQVEGMKSSQPPSRLTRLTPCPDGTQQVALPESTVPWRQGQRV